MPKAAIGQAERYHLGLTLIGRISYGTDRQLGSGNVCWFARSMSQSPGNRKLGYR